MKEKVLKELYEKRGEYVSGEDLKEKFKVSRTAIWKHMNSLKKEGYMIETTQKKGYKLIESDGKLIPEALKNDLSTKEIGSRIIYFDTIDSTNNYSKRIAKDTPHGTIIISEEQSGGRGRLGRNWISPKGEGIWMSILLKPEIPPTEGMKMTQIAAAAACQAIRDVTALEAYIKWPNDIVVHGKKVCGILTEMAGELNQIDYLIVGIGINANNLSFPKEFKDVATSLAIEKGEKVDRKTLILDLLSKFEALYCHYIMEGKLDETLSIIRNYSAVLGKSVRIIKGNQECYAIVEEINDEGCLKVRYEDGEEELLISGEVSIRGKEGYI
ncbi:BirA family transcriptional regulator, biotin operon repressor / biotin-[acetyl-CoA-carboxylase] ligase [Natronincola peptidivorans]|uniref:Bifunctional ligase/repressor BirA n=1 Tax=Natronincola peptidivorans TaxID=426128 RepID=A0A1I0HBK8_9FIRM|nr:biotin--[acetyl-CoA-carboxylase] ligase [Natronincola peptidivorans]SET81103.1 BirA family transcriptional regulator, biotin operon repressor / biotin-[acetyl-CoA-carboxylase] ligase [Natronincola peptidivorans]